MLRTPPPPLVSFLLSSSLLCPIPSPKPHHHLSGSARRRTIAMAASEDKRIARIASTIRVIPDFPKPGVMFQDITTMLLEPKAFQDTIDMFVERYKDKGISVVAGIEARGFIFGPPIALAIGAKFVPMRKPKKLPGDVISEEYSLEYGTDRMEMHIGAVQPGEKALIIDDLIATGGTLSAAVRLLGMGVTLPDQDIKEKLLIMLNIADTVDHVRQVAPVSKAEGMPSAKKIKPW